MLRVPVVVLVQFEDCQKVLLAEGTEESSSCCPRRAGERSCGSRVVLLLFALAVAAGSGRFKTWFARCVPWAP